MKKSLSLSLVLLVLVAGCSKAKDKKEKKRKKQETKSMNIPLAQAGEPKFFDDAADAFTLEEERKIVAENSPWIEHVDETGFKTIHFDFDKYAIRDDQKDLLHVDTAQAKHVVASGKRVVVEGHACHSAGSKTYNLVLSQHRAEQVAKSLGINDDELKVVGRGTEVPVAYGTREQQAPNRRVEFYSF